MNPFIIIIRFLINNVNILCTKGRRTKQKQTGYRGSNSTNPQYPAHKILSATAHYITLLSIPFIHLHLQARQQGSQASARPQPS